MYKYTHTYAHIYAYIFIYIYMHTYTYYTHTYIYIYIYVCVCKQSSTDGQAVYPVIALSPHLVQRLLVGGPQSVQHLPVLPDQVCSRTFAVRQTDLDGIIPCPFYLCHIPCGQHQGRQRKSQPSPHHPIKRLALPRSFVQKTSQYPYFALNDL